MNVRAPGRLIGFGANSCWGPPIGFVISIVERNERCPKPYHQQTNRLQQARCIGDWSTLAPQTLRIEHAKRVR